MTKRIRMTDLGKDCILTFRVKKADNFQFLHQQYYLALSNSFTPEWEYI